MSFWELIVLSAGLAMDATAVSLACSVCHSQAKKRLLFKAAFLFGLFQALMPVLGYFIGLSVNNLISNIDHWIAFLLLSFVGLKMIFEPQEENADNLFSNKKIIIFAIATSIDAFVVGITFSFMETNLWLNVAAIGIVTFLLSLAAGFLGKSFAKLDPRLLKAAGGIAIITIGTKILLGHILG